jgi:uncharacterized protein YggE
MDRRTWRETAMFQHGTVDHPFGITSFGSAIVRGEPDVVSIEFAVNNPAPELATAFGGVHETAGRVREFLGQRVFGEVATSRLALSEKTAYAQGETRFVGYQARVASRLIGG